MTRTPFLLAVTLLTAPAGVAAQTSAPAAETLTLDAAIRLAIENNLTLQNARLQVQKAEGNVSVARTRRLPSFETQALASQLLTPAGFTFPAGAFGVYEATGPIPSTETRITSPREPLAYLSVQASQPLSQLSKIGLNIDAATVERDVERTRLRADELSLVNSVKRQYFAMVQTASALAATVDTIALYRELDRSMQQRAVQKVALRADTLDVQYKLAEEELARTTHTNTLATQKEQLNQLLGRDVRTRFEIEHSPALAGLDVDLSAAHAHALSSRPDVEQARLRVKQAELDYRIKKADRIPEVSLTVSYSSYFNIDVLPRNLATAGVQLKWEPFDWGRKGHELATRSLIVEQARRTVRETEDRTVVEVNALFRKLMEARARLDVVDVAHQAARERLRVKTNQFQVQAVLLSDVLQSRAEVTSTEDLRQQAWVTFWTAKANFDQAVGEEGIR
jgi:outer membrane protein TolC